MSHFLPGGGVFYVLLFLCVVEEILALSPEDDPENNGNDCHQDQEFLDCFVG